jgi:hypothetical protein
LVFKYILAPPLSFISEIHQWEVGLFADVEEKKAAKEKAKEDKKKKKEESKIKVLEEENKELKKKIAALNEYDRESILDLE